ncbi:hypothetical protein BGZ94_001657 [Podila epigama]|nr:hypothetical protein BGZ94_001657 [Podila epigama]
MADVDNSQQQQQKSTQQQERRPKVLIVGAGIGGLMLGILLHKGGVPFEIFERAREVKPLGSAMSLGACFAQLFQQIGILEEFEKIGKPAELMEVFDEDLNPVFSMDFACRRIVSGAIEYIVARPDLYALLLRHVPQENIHMSTKIESYEENEDEGVVVRCSDGKVYQGDILIGADGAYSAVRQQMYKNLKEKGTLPPSDDMPLPFNCVCLVGQTEVLDPEEFPGMKLEHSQFVSMLKPGEYKWTTFTTIQNTICWFVIQYLEEGESKSGGSSAAGRETRDAEWGSEAAETMCNEVRDFKLAGGKPGKVMTMGDMIDRTPKHLISKVMLEEKLFKTWYSGRTVLLGDACHKVHPASGAGALSAIQDAVALANWICSLKTTSQASLDGIFEEYYAERYPALEDAFRTTQVFKSIGGNTWTSTMARAVFKYMPDWLLKKTIVKGCMARPQVSFLPLVKDRGSVPPGDQPSLRKTLALQ